MECPRCESEGRTPGVGVHKALGPNGVKSLICDHCLDEVDCIIIGTEYENEENEEIHE